MKVSYQGGLRNVATHLRSGNQLITDAPPDNHGRGEAFSPTDLLCTSLASCMITLMGITAAAKNITLGKIDADIEKIMASEPRRVSEIKLDIAVEDLGYSEKERSVLEHAAHTCPVAKSIHPDIKLHVNFRYY
ncbi:MAG: OsmC family protein [Flavobacteriales bacterium]|nr:OsmC family protein [Flavobacteriales bacterium]